MAKADVRALKAVTSLTVYSHQLVTFLIDTIAQLSSTERIALVIFFTVHILRSPPCLFPQLTVLEETTVVASPEVYSKQKDRKPERIPSRASAPADDEDEEGSVSKGCFYFVACLDSFWVL